MPTMTSVAVAVVALCVGGTGVTSNITMQQSVTSGVAPLSVLFSAIQGQDNNTFSTLKLTSFEYDFGDPTAGNYGQGMILASRNKMYEAWGGRVYEAAGDYVPTLKYTPFGGATTQLNGAVHVISQDAAFPGGLTLCCSTSGNFTGAPAGSTNVTVTGYQDAQISSFIAAHAPGTWRILLCAGETFHGNHTGVGIQITSHTLFRFGKYGSGANPICINDSIISGSSVIIQIGTNFTGGGFCTDAAIQDIEFQGTTTNLLGRGVVQFDAYQLTYSPITYQIVGTAGRCTILRCTFHNVASPVYISGNGSAVVDCTMDTMPGIGTLGILGIAVGFNGGSANTFIAGNYVDRSNTGEHGIRGQGWYQFCIFSNYVKGATSTKHLMAIREFAPPAPSGLAYLTTQYGVVCNNYFDASGGQGQSSHLQIAPQNGTSYGLQQYIVISHNWFGPYDYAGGTGGFSDPDILATASNCIVRHNIHCQSSFTLGTGNAGAGIQLQNGTPNNPGAVPPIPPTPACDNWFIDHNSAFCGTALKISYFTWASNVTNIDCRNTLYFAPAAIRDGSGNSNQASIAGPQTGLPASFALSHNSTNAQIKSTDPQWQSAAIFSPAGPPYFPAAPADFVLLPATGSYALTGATNVGKLGASMDLSVIGDF